MFSGSVVWRGIIYTILMTLGKLVCGLWLVRLSVSIPRKSRFTGLKQYLPASTPHFWGKRKTPVAQDVSTADDSIKLSERVVKAPPSARTDTQSGAETSRNQNRQTDEISSVLNTTQNSPDKGAKPRRKSESQHLAPTPPKPLSLYPASILGLAMVARGEIGFLISSLAESNGIFASAGSGKDDTFLIVTWAIVLCTVIGPVGVGLLVRRVKRLEKEKVRAGGEKDVLGVWEVG
jgi:hypothetical protein